jgi:RNA polymerase sigma factor (sigma-70 family)
MQQQELIPHLFRTEYSKICAVLSRFFGIEHMEVAEDIASETFVLALETWSYKGIPENPVAWLYVVAKNKARNYIQRNILFATKIASQIQQATTDTSIIDLSEENIADSQLQMLFTLCHPSIPPEAQIGLSLRILCGFGIDEIATAFLTNKETINKRLFRAREKLRAEHIVIQLPPPGEIDKRVDTVLTTLYLLFNEGYYSESNDTIIREELCTEAVHLVELLMHNKQTDLPKVNALYALMCFHASRFPARKNSHGEMVLYEQQDETLWDYELIAKGAYYLNKASQGNCVSKYHLEAGIAYWHTIKADTPKKWETILQLYNRLLQTEYSPIAALNRTFALAKANGKVVAIAEAEKLKLTDNHYYYTLLGELYTNIDNDKAKQHFVKAISLAKTQTDKRVLARKIEEL